MMTPPSRSRIQKHHRTRTGCLICRSRRIKCDERRPSCWHCEKSSRECFYSTLQQSNAPRIQPSAGSQHTRKMSEAATSKDSQSDSDPKVKVEEIPDQQSNQQLSRRNSLIAIQSPEFYRNQSIDSAKSSPSSHKVTGGIPIEATAMEYVPFPPRSPKSSNSPQSFFFTKYHQETIGFAHYCLFNDNRQLCNKFLLAIAQQYDPLRHALVAFSALVCSAIKPFAREQAFLHYALTIKEMRLRLSSPPADDGDYQGMVATILQLSAFDHFLGDDAKCFRHMEGAARIMQAYSDPIKHSSSATGRSLFEWYCAYEDYCCISGVYKQPLPKEWRYTNVQIRQKLADRDYPGLTPTDRKSRLLDDLWPQLRARGPKFNDIQEFVAKMPKFEDKARFELATRLELELTQLIQDVVDFLNSSQVQEILQPAPKVPVISTDPTCLPPPFEPYICQYPPAGYFRIVLYGIIAYMRRILLPPILTEMDKWIINERTEEQDPFFDSIEVCRTYAGMELLVGKNPVSLFPCWSALILAAMTCPPSLRKWTWSRLIHFKNLGHERLEAVKMQIATSWQTQEILEHSPETELHLHEKRFVDVEDDKDVAAIIENMDLQTDSDSTDVDEGMESLVHLRGLFWTLQS